MKKWLPMGQILVLLLMTVPMATWADLSKEARADLLRMEIIHAVKKGRLESAWEKIQEYRRLGVEMPSALAWVEAQVAYRLKKYPQSKKLLETYINKLDKKDKRYKKALALYYKIEKAEKAARIAQKKAERKRHLARLKTRRRQAAVQMKKAKPRRHCKGCPAMVSLPGGSFQMGDQQGDGDNDERPVKSIILRPFAISQTEVTWKQYQRCVKAGACQAANDHHRWGKKNRPVIFVSWQDAKDYARWLRKKTRKPYRLPTEAEWEYAARADWPGAYPARGGRPALCDHANIADVALKECDDGYIATAPVGSYLPNGFGLVDMGGNVWEWVEDCYTPSHENAPADGAARVYAACEQRVIRGGSGGRGPWYARVSNRAPLAPDSRQAWTGFRVAMDTSDNPRPFDPPPMAKPAPKPKPNKTKRSGFGGFFGLGGSGTKEEQEDEGGFNPLDL